MHIGHCADQYTFQKAPAHWQDFVLSHRITCKEKYKRPQRYEKEGTIDFEESALLVGTTATFVGELQRGADGIMALKPKQENKTTEPKHFDAKSTWFQPLEVSTPSFFIPKSKVGEDAPMDKV